MGISSRQMQNKKEKKKNTISNWRWGRQRLMNVNQINNLYSDFAVLSRGGGEGAEFALL